MNDEIEKAKETLFAKLLLLENIREGNMGKKYISIPEDFLRKAKITEEYLETFGTTKRLRIIKKMIIMANRDLEDQGCIPE